MKSGTVVSTVCCMSTVETTVPRFTVEQQYPIRILLSYTQTHLKHCHGTPLPFIQTDFLLRKTLRQGMLWTLVIRFFTSAHRIVAASIEW